MKLHTTKSELPKILISVFYNFFGYKIFIIQNTRV